METRNSPFSNNEDRISNLHDALIYHILSFLDMKYVVQTSVLSRRWRYLWTSLPTLNFSFYEFSDLMSDKFLVFVERVLVLRDSFDIRRFYFTWHGGLKMEYDFTSHFNTWILAAVRRNVQELSIDVSLWNNKMFRFPPCLFFCKTLTKLELNLLSKYSSKIILPNSMCLPRLKSLKLCSLSFDDEELTNKLFSSCPVLESLIITESRLNINISSLTLMHFELQNHYYDTSDSVVKTIKLYAPNLTSLSCKSYMSHDYSLENLSSLVTANIEMIVEEDKRPETLSELPAGVKELYAQNMMKLLRALHNVKDLTLSHWFVEVLSGAPDVSDSQPTEFCYLRCLKLQTRLSRDSFHAISYLLKISPNIESLSLVMTEKCMDDRDNHDDPPIYPFCDEIKFNSTNIGDSLEAGLSLPCMLHHLKLVHIKAVLGCINELKFLEILLKNAMVLEKVVLESCNCKRCNRQYCLLHCRLFSPHTERRMKKFTEKLQTLPRASSNIKILVL